MKSIYTISPVIYADRLPESGDIGKVISEYFFLFKVYHESKYMILMYMNYINKWYEDVFNKLQLKIIQFDYPDTIQYSSGTMVNYINEHYELSGESVIEVEQELIIQSGKHYLFGTFEVMFNAISSWEVIQAASGLFEYDNLSDAIKIIAIYLQKDLKGILCTLVKTLYEYDKAFQDLDQSDYYYKEIYRYGYDVFDNPYIDSNYAIYYELRKFVEIERRHS